MRADVGGRAEQGRVAAFYFDHNVDRHIRPALERRGHRVTLTREVHLQRASDALQLLTTAQHGWILVTHNEADFKLLQEAWRLKANAAIQEEIAADTKK